MTTSKLRKSELLSFAKHLEESKGLKYEWPNAVKEAIKHLREIAENAD